MLSLVGGVVELPSSLIELSELSGPDLFSLTLTLYLVYAVTHVALKLGSNITTKLINDQLYSHFPEPKGTDISWFFGVIAGTIRVGYCLLRSDCGSCKKPAPGPSRCE